MRNFNKELAQIEVMEVLGFNMEEERAELQRAIVADMTGGESYTYEIKTKNPADRRRWVTERTQNRLDVVEAIGGRFTPSDAEKLADGKWYGLRMDVQIRVIKGGN